MDTLRSMFLEGSPYAFVSYTHRDEIVLKTLEQIQQVYNIWWDGEMLAGDRWDSERAMPAIQGCNCVLAFYSHNYVNSVPCRNEIEAALKFDKKIIPVSVEGVSLKQLIQDVEDKLDAENEDLRKIQKLCTEIGGGAKSTEGNKVLYVDLKSEQWADSLYKSLEQYLKPTVYLREWLYKSDDYRIKKEFETLLENGIDPDEGSDESDETNTEYIFSFLAGFRYAIENKGAVIPENLADELGRQLMYEYYEESRDITLGDFTWVLYRIMCEIRNIVPFLEKKNDYIPKYDARSEETASKTLKWMHDRGILNGTINRIYYDNPNHIMFSTYDVVQIVENLLKYIEKTYPEAIKVFVFGK